MKDCELAVGAQGSEVNDFSWRRGVVRTNATKEVGTTHVVPYNAMFFILGDPLEVLCLRGSDALNFTASRECVDMSNEQLKLILVLLAVCCAV